MKRSVLLAIVAAVALAAGLTASAAATDAGTATVAQKAKSKKKGKAKAKCPAKKKAKGKARKAQADAAAKKKAKKKAAKCKQAKPKKKGKAQPKGKGKPKPGAAIVPDGLYKDAAKQVDVEVSGNGTKAKVTFPPLKCTAGMRLPIGGDLASSGGKVRVNQEDKLFGGAGRVWWSITIDANLSYTLSASWYVQFPDQAACEEEMRASGKLRR